MTVLESPLASKIKHIYKHIIGDFFFFDNFVIAEAKQDINFSQNTDNEFITHIDSFYKGKSFFYVSNRVHEYNPNDEQWKQFFQQGLHKNMSGCLVIDYNKTSEELDAVEQKFANLNLIYKCFNSFEEFIFWITNNTPETS